MEDQKTEITAEEKPKQSGLLPEVKIEDPHVVEALATFQRSMVQRELKKTLEMKEEMRSKGIEKDSKEEKAFAKTAYLKFLFIQCEVNVAKKHAATDQVPCKILEDLFIGSVGSAVTFKSLQDLGITHVITCLDFEFTPFKQLKYLHVPILDTPKAPVEEHFKAAHEFFNQARKENGKVLVHCFAGISRSSTIACAIVMQELGVSTKEALAIVAKNRQKVNPNSGFVQKLNELEKLLKVSKTSSEETTGLPKLADCTPKQAESTKATFEEALNTNSAPEKLQEVEKSAEHKD